MDRCIVFECKYFIGVSDKHWIELNYLTLKDNNLFHNA